MPSMFPKPAHPESNRPSFEAILSELAVVLKSRKLGFTAQNSASRDPNPDLLGLGSPQSPRFRLPSAVGSHVLRRAASDSRLRGLASRAGLTFVVNPSD